MNDNYTAAVQERSTKPMIADAIQSDLCAALRDLVQRRANLHQAIADKRWDDALTESTRLRYALSDLDFAIEKIRAL